MVSCCWGIVVGFGEGWGVVQIHTRNITKLPCSTLPTGESCSCDYVLLVVWVFLRVFLGLGRGQGLIYAHTGKEHYTQVREL